MATQTFEELIAGANKIKDNELPESNTHNLVGDQLLQMTNKMQEENSNNGKKFSELTSNNSIISCSSQYLGFVLDCYVNEQDINLSTEYKITNISKNHPQYGTQVRINLDPSINYKGDTNPIIKVGPFKLKVNWDVIPDGINYQGADIILNNSIITNKELHDFVLIEENTTSINSNTEAVNSISERFFEIEFTSQHQSKTLPYTIKAETSIQCSLPVYLFPNLDNDEGNISLEANKIYTLDVEIKRIKSKTDTGIAKVLNGHLLTEVSKNTTAIAENAATISINGLYEGFVFECIADSTISNEKDYIITNIARGRNEGTSWDIWINDGEFKYTNTVENKWIFIGGFTLIVDWSKIEFGSNNLNARIKINVNRAKLLLKSIHENKIADGAVTGDKLANRAVTGVKTTMFDVIQNFVNPQECEYENAWGTTNPSYSMTGYISVTKGDVLQFSYNNGVACQIRQIALYDSNKNKINDYNTPGDSYIANVNSGWMVPDDDRIAHMKCAVSIAYLTTDNANKFQIEKSEDIHPYVEFGDEIAKLKEECYDFDLIKSHLESNSNIAILPSKLYLTDKRTDLFFSPLYKNFQFDNKIFCRVTPTGSDTYRQFKNLITIDPKKNGKLVFDTYDEDFNIIDSSEVETVVTSVSKTGDLTAIFIGSSITAGGQYLEKIKEVMGEGFEALGTRRASLTAKVHFEGVGGWSLSNYYSIQKSKTNAPSPFWHPKNGRYWGVVEFWKDVMTYDEFASSSQNPNYYPMNGRKESATNAGFDPNGYITNSTGRLKINDIMYSIEKSSFIQYNGSDWVNIEQPSEWGFDFVKYGNMWNISAPDAFVMAELTTNEFRGNKNNPNFTNYNNYSEKMITALKEWSSSINIVIIIPISTLGRDYSLGEFVQLGNYRMWQSRKNQIKQFNNRENENIYLIDDAIFFDEDYGYPLSTDSNMTKPNQEYTGDEKLRVQTGSPHPTTEQRYLLADGMLGILQFLRN